MAQFSGFENVAFSNQFEPVGNKIMYRALPLTVGVTATQASVGLAGHFVLGERFIDLHKLMPADAHVFFARVMTTHVDKLRSEEHTSELQSRGHLVCRL